MALPVLVSTVGVRPTVDVFPHTNYVVSVVKEDDQQQPKQKEKDQSGPAKLYRMKQRYERHQATIISVEGVLLVNVHNHPHVLLLQHRKTLVYRLPGGKCRLGEDPEECLMRKLARKLLASSSGESAAQSGPGETPMREGGNPPGGATSSAAQLFRVTELLAEWFRPNFDPLMYPYRPPHISKEKEARSIYLVQLASEGVLGVRPDFECVAVPLFELHDNAAKYGSIVANIPLALSRLHINLC